jgi:hypothetical protein
MSVCYHQGALPGEPGNMVITGHNYVNGAHFGRLGMLEEGDLVVLDRRTAASTATRYTRRRSSSRTMWRRWTSTRGARTDAAQLRQPGQPADTGALPARLAGRPFRRLNASGTGAGSNAFTPSPLND